MKDINRQKLGAVTLNFPKPNKDKVRSFVMCPTPGCKFEMEGTWKKYETGEIRDGLKVYKCPACKQTFTVNDFGTNCIPVPDVDGIGVVYNSEDRTIKFRVNGKDRFTDSEGDVYVYLPLKFITSNNRFFYLSNIDESTSDADILALLKDRIN